MIARHGIIRAAERAVARRKDPSGYTTLVEMGMQDLAFEAVVLRYPDDFSADAVARARERLASYSEPNQPMKPTGFAGSL